MPQKKDYLIQLFLKCSLWLYSAKKNLSGNEIFLRSCFQSIEDKDFKNIINKYGIERFEKEISDIMDNNFSIEDVENLIVFFRSATGKKLSNKNLLLQIEKIMNDICVEREQELSKMERE